MNQAIDNQQLVNYIERFWVVPSSTLSNVFYIFRGTNEEVKVYFNDVGVLLSNKPLTEKEKHHFKKVNKYIFKDNQMNNKA